jgi:phage terminase large subunit
LIYTTAIDKIRRIQKRKRIIQGGSSSGKTYAILTILIDKCAREPNLSVSVVSESMPHLRRGAIRDFVNIMKSTERYYEDHFNKTSLTYNFANGSYIEFFSADAPDKLKGARRDILYINECNHVSYEAYQQLSIRTHKEIYLDYNPDRQFWAITEVSYEPDAEKIILKYTDNEALSQSTIEQFQINRDKALTSEYWANWCKVYIDGEVGSLEGVVFDNWSQTDYIPKEAELIGIGLDFGFTNDPTTAISVWCSDNIYYLDELFYGTNMTNGTINSMLQTCSVNKSTEIWADSADPKSIKELKNYGWRIAPVTKGPDSIVWGIGIMQEQTFKVTMRSTNLIEELQNYQWVKDVNGTKTNKPIDAFNHAIDATRYLFMMKVGKRNMNKTPFVIGGDKKLPFKI